MPNGQAILISRLLVSTLAFAAATQAGAPWAMASTSGPDAGTRMVDWPADLLGPDGTAVVARPWRIDWLGGMQADADAERADAVVRLPVDVVVDARQQTAPSRPVAFEYSEGYTVRRKIHFYASFATLPLFVTQYYLGDKLYDYSASSGQRTAHTAVATSIGVLFGVNTVTGVWNLIEARKDPNGRTRRLVHGVLMLAADAGFVATGALAPDEDGSGNRKTHRTVALTSIGVATASYLYMLFTR